ncbi:hypothetical protein SY88_01320 [Clostridiales bacterium PH28_bin88]|nr:hypothetical protein SY88_01320 [Clostridiales bacterium PH28_bin88]
MGKGVPQLLPVCLLCEKTPEQGIRGGILVSRRFLCEQCQKEIIGLNAGDARYPRLIERLKRLWG